MAARVVAIATVVATSGCRAELSYDSWYRDDGHVLAHRTLTEDRWAPVRGNSLENAVAMLSSAHVVALSTDQANELTDEELRGAGAPYLVRAVAIAPWQEIRISEDQKTLVIHTENPDCLWGKATMRRRPVVVSLETKPSSVLHNIQCDAP